MRALYRGGWGYATFNDLDDLPGRVREACEIARLVGRETTHFAAVPPVVDRVAAPMIVDFRTVPLARKKALMEEYNRIVLGHNPKIQTSSIRYGDSFKQRWFASSEGAYIGAGQRRVRRRRGGAPAAHADRKRRAAQLHL